MQGESLWHGRTMFAFKILLLAAAYYGTAQLSLRLALVEHNVTPLWPPIGIAVLAFLLYGRRLWPGVALAAFLVNLPITPTVTAAAATAVGNTLAPLLAATLLTRLRFRPQIDRLGDALAIVFPAALLSTVVSATIGAATLVASDAIPADDVLAAWSVWWAGDAMGILVFAPFLLILPSVASYDWNGPRKWLEAAALWVILIAVSFIALTSGYALMFLVLSVVGWAAWRFQQVGAAPAALMVSVLATWAAVAERGPFSGAPLLEKMLTLQAFNASVAVTSFVFAALVTERMRSREALQPAADELDDRVRRRTLELSEANRQLAEAHEVAKIGAWEWEIATGRVDWSDELYRIHGIEPEALPMTFDRALGLVDADDRPRIEANVARAFERRTRDVPDIEYRITRPDGTSRIVVGRGRLTLDDAGDPVRMVGDGPRRHRAARARARASHRADPATSPRPARPSHDPRPRVGGVIPPCGRGFVRRRRLVRRPQAPRRVGGFRDRGRRRPWGRRHQLHGTGPDQHPGLRPRGAAAERRRGQGSSIPSSAERG